jgi:predicted nucleic acid-binding protein
MIAVSDTSPLIALSRLGYSDYLPIIFEKIYIPRGVASELARKDDNARAATETLINQGIIVVKTTTNYVLVQALNQELGRGEAEAIALSLELKPDVIILDDLEARVSARSFELRVIGTLGVIRALVRKELIKETPEDLFEKLQSIDFWISQELFSQLFL